jgi:hypothetical protein
MILSINLMCLLQEVWSLNNVDVLEILNMYNDCLMFIPCIIRHIRRNQQYALIVPLFYSTCWLLHVSAVACHHQGAIGTS